jgi:hypothetical protein
MKYIFLSIFVLLAAQPLQVSACDMHDAQETAHMPHDGMQQDQDMDMDCCDHDPSDSSDSCDSMTHCKVGTAPVVAIASYPVSILFTSTSHQHRDYSNHPPSRSTTPPFRPPIA